MRRHFLVSGYSDITITGTPELAQSGRIIQHSCTCLGGSKSPRDKIIQIALHNGSNLKDIIPHMLSIYGTDTYPFIYYIFKYVMRTFK